MELRPTTRPAHSDIALQVFAGVALFVGAFVIYNTFTITVAIFAATLSDLIAGDLDEELLADHVVEINSNLAFVGTGLDPAIAAEIAEIDGVRASVPVRDSFAEVDGDFTPRHRHLHRAAHRGGRPRRVDGTVTGLGTAEDRDLAVGDRVAVRFQQGAATLTVAGICDRGEQLMQGWLVDNSVLDTNRIRNLDTRILVSSSGADAALLAEIDAALAGNPTASVSSRDDYIDDQTGQLSGLLTLLYALLGMSVVVALLGIVNTMSLSIYERTRELGLLRAVGMTSQQLRRAVRYESAIIALIGTLAGLALGVFLGWAAFDALSVGYYDFTMPWGSLIAIGVAGLVAGLLSGVLPARRAGRLEVLDAIAV